MSVFASGLTFDPDNPIDINFVIDNSRSSDRTMLRTGTRAFLVKRIFGSRQELFSEWIITGFAKDGKLVLKPVRELQFGETKTVTEAKFYENFEVRKCRVENQGSGN